MGRESKKTVKQLTSELNHDFTRFSKDFLIQLQATTPIQTGNARRGWVNKYNGDIGKRSSFEVSRNRVPYSGVLDTGTSRQAPNGIVEPAFKRTRKPK